MLLVAAGVAVLLALSPLNVYDVPIWNQTTRLMRVLKQNDMIKDGIIVANANVSEENINNITIKKNGFSLTNRNKMHN
jgi:hypothetical protein